MTPRTSDLANWKAAIEAGLEVALPWEGEYQPPRITTALTTALEAYRQLAAYVDERERERAALVAREKKLQVFVEHLLDNTHGDKSWYVHEARILLAELNQPPTPANNSAPVFE